MLNNFFKYIKLTKSNDNIPISLDFEFVYGNGNKNLKTKSFIYKEYEFYFNDLVNKAAYIEQVIIDTLILDKEIEKILNENLIIFETLEDYFLIFLSRSESKTYKITKKNITFEQLKVIVEETLNENINKIFYCINYEKYFELYIYDIKENQNKDYHEIKIIKKTLNTIAEPILLFSKSLQLRRQFKNYKNVTTIIVICLSFVLFNEFYLKNKINNFISRKYIIVKIKEKKIMKNKIETIKTLKKYTLLEKKSKIQIIKLNKIKDFKKNYKTEIKKLI